MIQTQRRRGVSIPADSSAHKPEDLRRLQPGPTSARQAFMMDKRKDDRTRKRLEDIVTESAVDKVTKYVNLARNSLDSSLPIAEDQEEQRRRDRIYRRAYVLTGRVALAYLRERAPSDFRVICYSGMRCAETAIREGRADYRIVRPRKADMFRGRVANACVLSAYEGLKTDLRPCWREATSAQPRLPKQHFVSKKSRYGEAQQLGAARYEVLSNVVDGTV